MPSYREAYFLALKRGIPKAIADFVLEEISGYSTFELARHFDDEIKNYALFEIVIQRYLDGEMVEYIFEKAYFLSTEFKVNKDVLIPRQETEQLVLKTAEYIKEMFGDEKINIADTCTGSGCIGILLAKMFPMSKVYLTDISEKALKIASENVKNILRQKNDVELLLGDMLEPLKNRHIDVIVCNPPYIEDEKTIDSRTWEQEPHLALLAKPDVLFYERLLKLQPTVTNKKFLIAFEIGEDMDDRLTQLVNQYCNDCEYSFEKDIYGKTRFLFIKHQ